MNDVFYKFVVGKFWVKNGLFSDIMRSVEGTPSRKIYFPGMSQTNDFTSLTQTVTKEAQPAAVTVSFAVKAIGTIECPLYVIRTKENSLDKIAKRPVQTTVA